LVVVVGLGNPGARYARTRHNVGFRVLERVRLLLAARVLERGPRAEIHAARAGGSDVLLVRPLLFMNESGEALSRVVSERGVAPADLLVVSDDVNLPLGRLRLRLSGGPGGHNGLASVVEALGTEEFPRLRVGVGVEGLSGDLTDFVLGPFAPEEEEAAEAAVLRAAEAVVSYIENGPERAMSDFNR
jgi:PTH1 family peptidyl-tRNA hydrolase